MSTKQAKQFKIGLKLQSTKEYILSNLENDSTDTDFTIDTTSPNWKLQLLDKLFKSGIDPEISQEIIYINEMKQDLRSGNFSTSSSLGICDEL